MINSNNSEYAITHESELAYVLSKFNTDFIYNTVNESIKNRLSYMGNTPNMVNALEQNFITTKTEYPDNISQIEIVRNETYENIIKILCDNYALIYNDNDSNVVDIYTAASIMYSLLISDFQKNIITFFINYIIREKSSIYSMLSDSINKKSKDSSTIYSKKVFKNQKLGLISANLNMVVDSICNSFDISFDTYVKYVYNGDNDITKFILNTLSPVSNFFKDYIGSAFNSEFRPILLTSIRLELQKSLVDEDINKLF